MANHYFQFKSFRVDQSGSAMKVCTDSCVFGAWVAQHFEGAGLNEHLLDVGAGTGLLSLMVAQKTEYKIHGVEIDRSSTLQALANFAKSPWPERLSCEEADIKDFSPLEKFDLIICNPPFYKEHLSSSDKLKNQAMHEGDIDLKMLIQCFVQLLKASGKIALLLPFSRIEELKKVFEQCTLYINDELFIRQTEAHHFFRYCVIASLQKGSINHSEITIKVNDHYSNEFVSLLKDYYLHL